MPGALEGIRIVDLTNIILGPYGTMLLADQGADVIKDEAPEGDAVRHIGKPGKTPGMGPTYLYVNRNKRSLCLDLKNQDARAALLKVVATADAFVHALRPQAITSRCSSCCRSCSRARSTRTPSASTGSCGSR